MRVKRCSCGIEYTKAEYLELPRQRTKTFQADGLDVVERYANCTCGSTMMIFEETPITTEAAP